MNQFYCEKEEEIIEALRCASLDTALEGHASNCPICADTVAVTKLLQSGSVATPVLPDPDYIWWMGQLASKQMAVERATRSITLVRKISYLGLSAAALWLILAPGHVQSIASAFSKHEIWSSGGLRESALLMAIGTLFVTLLGSLFFARSEK